MLRLYHFYKVKSQDGTVRVGQYMGRQKGFECCVCGLGCNAHTFNFYWDEGYEDYETLGFGNDHMPEIVEDLGERSDCDAIVDNPWQNGGDA